MKSECQHKWEKRRVCPDDCNIPLAGGVEDLTGGFCYGKDPNECNFSVYGWRCSICGAEPDFTARLEEKSGTGTIYTKLKGAYRYD